MRFINDMPITDTHSHGHISVTHTHIHTVTSTASANAVIDLGLLTRLMDRFVNNNPRDYVTLYKTWKNTRFKQTSSGASLHFRPEMVFKILYLCVSFRVIRVSVGVDNSSCQYCLIAYICLRAAYFKAIKKVCVGQLNQFISPQLSLPLLIICFSTWVFADIRSQK